MEFVFPKDEELFQDLSTVQKDLDYDSEQFLDLLGGEEESTFGSAFRDVQEEQKARKGVQFRARGSNPVDVERRLSQQRNAYFRQRYEELEAVAARFAKKKKIGSFPHSSIASLTCEDEDGNETHYELDYFSEMDKACGFMDGSGWVGSFLRNAQQELNTIKRKTPLLSFITLFILFVGVAVVLAGAQPIDFLPKFMVTLVTEKLWVRLPLLALMALAGWFLAMMGSGIREEKGMILFKIVANGLFLFLVAIGSTLVAMGQAFSGSEIAWYSLLPFGLYYILISLFFVVADIMDFFQKKKAARQAKKDFCARVEKNIQPMHRYIRFHTLWWQKQNPGKPLPGCIRNLQKSFDHLLKMYKKYDK